MKLVEDHHHHVAESRMEESPFAAIAKKKQQQQQRFDGSENSSIVRGKVRRKNGKASKFMQRAKKFAKQGKLGKGFDIDTETYNYFLSVLDLSRKNEFENEDEKGN
jgi:hypothetical protein